MTSDKKAELQAINTAGCMGTTDIYDFADCAAIAGCVDDSLQLIPDIGKVTLS